MKDLDTFHETAKMQEGTTHLADANEGNPANAQIPPKEETMLTKHIREFEEAKVETLEHFEKTTKEFLQVLEEFRACKVTDDPVCVDLLIEKLKKASKKIKPLKNDFQNRMFAATTQNFINKHAR